MALGSLSYVCESGTAVIAQGTRAIPSGPPNSLALGSSPLVGPAPEAINKLEDLYSAQRIKVIDCLRRTFASPEVSQSHVGELVELLHQLAGTAAYFGEEIVGEAARNLQHDLRRAPPNSASALIATYPIIMTFADLKR